MRDVSHENLNQFVGACAEPDHICIAMQYAPKGSLQVIIDKFAPHKYTVHTL